TDGTLFSFGRGTTAQPVANYRGDTSDPGFNPLSYSYNFGPVNYLQLPLVRRQASAFVRYDIVPEQVEAYARFMYTTYSADQQLAATPVSSGVGSTIPVTNSQIPAGLMTLLMSRGCPAGYSVVSPATSPPTCTDGTTTVNQNLTQRDAAFSFGRRTVEVGPRSQDNGYAIMQGLFGLRGTLPNDMKWDVYGSWGTLENVNLQGGNVSRSRLAAAYANPAVYASQGCATFNPFGAGNIAPACAAAIAIRASNILETEQTNFVGSLTGSLFDLPGGPLQFAVGAEYRKNEAAFRPDEFLASGDVVGFNAQQPVSGSIDVIEPFVEFAVPLLAEKPFVNYLGLDLGYRYSEYNLAGNHSTYKVALQWRPVESFQVRGSYNRAIRAPNISELFLPTQENFPTYADPCNFNSTFRTGPNGAQVAALCQAQGIPAASLPTYTQAFTQARAYIGGNVNLVPEEADTITAGIAWQSQMDGDFLSNLSLSVDYYSYDIEGIIGTFSVNSIITRCFNATGTNPTYSNSNLFCQLFTRDATFRPDEVSTNNQNLAGRRMKGVDVQVDWGFPLTAVGLGDRAGDLGFKLLLSHLLKNEDAETAVDPFYENTGTISQTIASAFPDYKAVLTTTWNVADFSFRYNFRWIDKMDVVNNDAQYTRPTIGVKPWVPTYVYHDLAARWHKDKYTVSAGINNIADKQPPIYTTDAQAGIQSNTDGSTYDVLGRRYFVSVSAKF
ncbi:MAG TPA: TonB-dependent receptor, partial [Gemmatimonadota bacterium]|nr:TonB-dependent receptor [Gemmatimonadota bacterium]